MDKLKQFIDDHRDEFDNIQLPEGHLERFEKKLPSRRKHSFWLYGLSAIAAAACIALIFFIQPPTASLTEDEVAICEIEELQLYYNMQMNEVVARIEKIYEEDPSQGTTELFQATQQVMNDNNQFEERILPELPCSEEGMFAMNQHYHNSIASLNRMLLQMEKVKEMDNLQ